MTRKRTLRRTAVAVIVAISGIFLPGVALAQGNTALIYTSVPQNVIDVIQDSYQKANPGYKLDVFRGGTAAVLARVAAERQAGSIAADLIWVADPSGILGLKNEGLLASYTSAQTEALPDAYRDPDNQYFAGRVLGMVIAYNTSLVSENVRPTGWRSLLEPRFKGKIGFPTPVNSGAAMVTVGALLQSPDFGEAFMAALGANGMRQLQNNGAAAQMTATGELMAAVGLDFQIRALETEGSPIAYVYPDDGAVFIPSPIALFKDSPNQTAATHFLDYILSVDGQETLVREANFIPARTDVEPPAGGPPVDIETLPLDADFITENRDRILEVYDANLAR